MASPPKKSRTPVHAPKTIPLAPVSALPQLKTLSVILHRDIVDAMRDGSVRAGTVTVPLSPKMLADLTPDERDLLAALDSRVESDGALVILFGKLTDMPQSGFVPFHDGEVTEASVVGALRAALAPEIAVRENFARELRATYNTLIDEMGNITRLGTGVHMHLAARPGPRHPALDELDAHAKEQRARHWREHEAKRRAAEAAERENIARARAVYIALPDEALVRLGDGTPPRWEPVRPSWAKPKTDSWRTPEPDEAVDIVERRAERLAHEANLREDLARAIPPSAVAAPA